MATDWNIRGRGKTCTLCEKAFEEGNACVSALKTAENGEWIRVDACGECWHGVAEKDAFFSTWRFTFRNRTPSKKTRSPVQRDRVETLFFQLMDEGVPEKQDAAYVLAVMLERNRVLIPRGTRPDAEGGLLRVYEHRVQGDVFVIRDPMLPLDQIGDVQQRVAGLLIDVIDDV